MNDMLEPSETSEQTPGKMIKAAREAKRVTIGEVVQRLLLSKQIVAALENDDYSGISAQVYAEGYLKAYAQFLQIPVDTILKSFRRLNIYSNHEIKAEVKTQVEDNFNLNAFFKNQNVRLILLVVAGALVLSSVVFLVIKLATSKGVEVNVSTHSSVSTPEVTTVTNSTNDVSNTQTPLLTTSTTEMDLEKSNESEADSKVVSMETEKVGEKSNDKPIMDRLAKTKYSKKKKQSNLLEQKVELEPKDNLEQKINLQ
jgi:cytoskeletal protein RodZ